MVQAIADSHPTQVPSVVSSRFNPKFSPEYIALLKEQAEGRKVFFHAQAKAEAEQGEEQAKEYRKILINHRELRESFLKEKHSASERSKFFKGQREEMAGLKFKQKIERQKLEIELKKKLELFHQHQKQEELSIRNHLFKLQQGQK